jgi:hypothetical protein
MNVREHPEVSHHERCTAAAKVAAASLRYASKKSAGPNGRNWEVAP